MIKRHRTSRRAGMAFLVVTLVTAGAGVGAAVALILIQRGADAAGHGLT
jgi:hypothetical protein